MADQTTGLGLDWDGANSGTENNANLFHPDNAIDVTAAPLTMTAQSQLLADRDDWDEYPPASYVMGGSVSGSMSLLLRPRTSSSCRHRDELFVQSEFALVQLTGRLLKWVSLLLTLRFLHWKQTVLPQSTLIHCGKRSECNDGDKFFLRYR